MRKQSLTRNNKETQIEVEINLDRIGIYKALTGKCLFRSNPIISLLLYFVLTSLALADTTFSCIVDDTAFKSILDDKIDGVEVLVPETLIPPTGSIPRRVEHKIKLKDGVIVYFELGGCTHYGYRISFSNISGFSAKDSVADNIEKFETIVKRVPTKDGEDGDIGRKWEMFKNYVEVILDDERRKYFHKDIKTGEYIEIPTADSIVKNCEWFEGDCGVKINKDGFEFYSNFTP